jgi:Fe-S cluster biogenesis protein NfuA
MLFLMKNDDLTNKVNVVIDQLRPYLKNDGGDMELIEITKDKKVRVRLLGACQNCSISPVTLKAGLEESLKVSVPEIIGVEAVEQ